MRSRPCREYRKYTVVGRSSPLRGAEEMGRRARKRGGATDPLTPLRNRDADLEGYSRIRRGGRVSGLRTTKKALHLPPDPPRRVQTITVHDDIEYQMRDDGGKDMPRSKP